MYAIQLISPNPTNANKNTITAIANGALKNKSPKTDSFEKGETKKLILYCIFTDEEVENDTIALSFHDRTSPYIGPLAIIHEPGGENE